MTIKLAPRQRKIDMGLFGYVDEEGTPAVVAVHYDMTRETADTIKRLLVATDFEGKASEERAEYLASLEGEEGEALDRAIASVVIGSNAEGLEKAPGADALGVWREGAANDLEACNMYNFHLFAALVRWHQVRGEQAEKNGHGADGTNGASA